MVQQTLIRPPLSRLGPATDAERKKIMNSSPVGATYNKDIDRDSAYEELSRRAEKAAEEEERLQQEEEREKRFNKAKRVSSRPRRKSRGRSRRSDSPMEAMLKSTLRSAGSTAGRQLVRGILGSLFKGR